MRTRPPLGVSPDGELCLPGDATLWEGWGGQPLAMVPSAVLRHVLTWAEAKNPARWGTLARAISATLDARRTSDSLADVPRALTEGTDDDFHG